MSIHRIMADAIALVHVAFVAFVVLGLVAILTGLILSKTRRGERKRWFRNFWFRMAHLAAIGYVVVQSWLGEMCPLTVWEARLREMAGQDTHSWRLEEVGFIGYWVDRLIFYDAPGWVFTVLYTAFGAAVVALMVIAPPRRPGLKAGD